MSKELSNDVNISKVRFVQFFVVPPETIIKGSAAEITRSDTYAGTEPVPNGLFDMRMGVTDPTRMCKTCDQDHLRCPGHHGHIHLAKPVFHTKFMDVATKLHRCVCYRCSHLLVDPEAPEVKNITNKKCNRQKRFELITRMCHKVKVCPSCNARQPDRTTRHDTMKIRLEWKESSSTARANAAAREARGGGSGNGSSSSRRAGGGRNADALGLQAIDEIEEEASGDDRSTVIDNENENENEEEDNELLEDGGDDLVTTTENDKKDSAGQDVGDGERDGDEDGAEIEPLPASVSASLMEAREKMLSAEDVLRTFKRITEEHAEVLGFPRRLNRPEWLICTVLGVLPPAARPSVRNETGQRSEDDITHVYIDIIKYNNNLKNAIDKGANPQTIEYNYNFLQYFVAQLVDNTTAAMYMVSKDRTGRPFRTLTDRLKHKDGRIRGNLMGKRVDVSARTVITPDPSLSIDELGVPMQIAMNLTFPEIVTPHNRADLQQLVDNGPDVYPGAKQILKVHQGNRKIRLRTKAQQQEGPPLPDLQLEIGDKVERHMLRDDYVLFNRQPSLHKMSMMGHRVRVMPHKSFRLNVCVCKSYNADFDGDEMNMHLPQSLQTHEEIRNLAPVQMHIISPRDSKPIMTIEQDVLVGVYRMTQDGVRLNARSFMNLMCSNPRHDGILPTMGDPNNRAWTGRQLLSTVLPENTNVRMFSKLTPDDPGFVPTDHEIIIRDGQIQQGIVEKKVYGQQSQGLVHSIFNDKGPDAVVSLLNNTQKLVCDWLVLNGFSVGVADLVVSPAVKAQLRSNIFNMKKHTFQLIHQVHTGQFENKSVTTNQQYFEQLISNIMNKEGQASMVKATMAAVDTKENKMLNMIFSGSKGSEVNFMQMVGVVGQQNVDGRRIMDGYDYRSLPHFPKFDDGPTSRGFVEHSFMDGLSPHEFFFHSMGGRVGLIDTAVRTSETGYIQRKLVKSMEDCSVKHDLSVRNAVGQIVQFVYGEDGIDCTHLEAVAVPYINMSDVTLADTYLIAHTKELSPYLDAQLLSELQKDEDAFDKAMLEHFQLIQEDRRFVILNVIVDSVNKKLSGEGVMCPVNFKRIIVNTLQIMEDYGMLMAPSDLDPRFVLQQVEALLERLTPRPTPLFKAVLRCYLSPKVVITKHRFSTVCFKRVVELIEATYLASIAQPGDVVGVTAAQSIGESLTQNTLNSFHQSGLSGAGATTQGVPRLKELFHVTKQMKTPEMTIRVKRGFGKADVESIKNTIQKVRFKDVVQSSQVFFDPFDNPEQTLIPEDKELLMLHSMHVRLGLDPTCEAAFQAQTEDSGSGRKRRSPWVLRFEFDRFQMYKLQIYFTDVRFALLEDFGDTLSCIFSDDNSNRLVGRVRLNLSDDVASNDILTEIMALEQSMLDDVILKGVPNIERAVMVPSPQENRIYDEISGQFVNLQEWTINTSGSNLLDVMTNPYVDVEHVYTNDVNEVLSVLGIEAARFLLYLELNKALTGSAGNVNYRHLSLLVDTMTNRGHMVSIDRHGINKGDIGPLAKCSFEETDLMLIKAGIFCETDKINGVSANIMLGQVPPCGTGDGAILMDTEEMLKAPMQSPWMEAYARHPEPARTLGSDQQTEGRGERAEQQVNDKVSAPSPDAKLVEKQEDDIIIV